MAIACTIKGTAPGGFTSKTLFGEKGNMVRLERKGKAVEEIEGVD